MLPLARRTGHHCRVATCLENLEKSENLTLVREKSGKLRKAGEIVIWMWCAMSYKHLPLHFSTQ